MDSHVNGSYNIPAPILTAPSSYPSPSTAALKLQVVGKHISDLQAPAAILDAAVVRKNCQLMNEAVQKLDVEFRSHVKSHKTTEITKLQVGESESIKLVCSTVSEIENLLPWLLESKSQGKAINVLYGLPISLSQIPRLAHIAHLLGEGTMGLFADYSSHIKALDQLDESLWPGRIPLWIPIDVGDHREGVAANSEQLKDIANALRISKRVRLAGLYTHMGASYASSSPEEALKYMAAELEGLKDGATAFLKNATSDNTNDFDTSKVVLSLGATPTATSIQNIQNSTAGAQRYREMIEDIKKSFILEFHAGVYPLNDMQQIASRARPSQSPNDSSKSLLSYPDIAFRILAEVASLYPDRGEKAEALVAAGTIALGREPCKSYSGWAVVSPWPSKSDDFYDPEFSKTGWIVSRISQEHGVLTWEGPQDRVRELQLGEKMLLWPNHACIAGVNFGWYYVVDSDSGDPEVIRDVWIRWRGW